MSRIVSSARRLCLLLLPLAAALAAAPLAAQQAPTEPPEPPPPTVKAQVPVEQFTLANGMRFLLVRRPEQATVMGGWVAHVGSANEHPGITGVAHLFEHMMFKGTRKIGTRNITRDLQIMAEQEKLQDAIRAQYRIQRERYRLGEIDDPYSAKNATPALVELEQRFQKLVDEQHDLMVKDEFDRIYTAAGASGMNATTTQDATIYWVTIPANKLELWFWMESDRLLEPVFREFYSERDVVQEERRMRVDSTPTGPFDEQLNAMTWTSLPYSWEPIGWMSDLKTLSMPEAQRFFSTYYAPNNVTAALVGNFDAAVVRRLAERYFGRIPRGKTPVPDVVTLEVPQLAQKRMLAECDCPPQLSVTYHAVAFENIDSYALDVVQGLLDGQTGRLNKDLVLAQQIASSASAVAEENKWAGTFDFSAETRGDATPGDLERAWNAEVKRLQEEPVPADELQKVKNQVVAGSYRRLENPFYLLIQLLFYDGWGDWTYLNTSAAKTLAVTPADVQRVAQKYLVPENATVAVYTRKSGTAAEPVPPELAGLSPQARQAVTAQLAQIRSLDDPKQLEQVLAQLEQQKGQVPDAMKPAFDLIEKTARARLAELQTTPKKEEPK